MWLFSRQPKKKLKLKEDYSEKSSETASIEIQSQRWGGNRNLSMEGISVVYFTSIENEEETNQNKCFYSYINDEN